MSTCPRCGVSFSCAMVDEVTAAHCWCTQLPALPATTLASLDTGDSQGCCLCAGCLQAASSATDRLLDA